MEAMIRLRNEKIINSLREFSLDQTLATPLLMLFSLQLGMRCCLKMPWNDLLLENEEILCASNMEDGWCKE